MSIKKAVVVIAIAAAALAVYEIGQVVSAAARIGARGTAGQVHGVSKSERTHTGVPVTCPIFLIETKQDGCLRHVNT